MNVKTLTGTSIHAALTEARRQLGDDVVLLESTPPQGDQPARIKVMVDQPVAAAPARTPQRAPQPAAVATAPQQAVGYGYHRPAVQEPLVAFEQPAQRPEQPAAFAESSSRYPSRPAPAPLAAAPRYVDVAEPQAAPRPSYRPEQQRAFTGRGQLFQEPAALSQPAAPAAPAFSLDPIQQLLETQLGQLHERLARLEQRLDSSFIGASQQWMTHPLFAELLHQGVRPATATRLFDALAARGFQPEAELENLRWGLAQELRGLLDATAPQQTSGTLVLVGPSGSGKTSLALKLAKNAAFFGRRRTAIFVITPEHPEATGYHNPVDLYRSYGLPVLSVSNEEEMRQSLERVQRFDQILIDTPPLPVREAEARRMMLRVKRMVDVFVPLQVHLALNTTRALETFDADYLRRLPLRPDAVALTHLDETTGWGRIAEWMLSLQMPIQFVSNGPKVPEGVQAFSPSWFVEEMMNL